MNFTKSPFVADNERCIFCMNSFDNPENYISYNKRHFSLEDKRYMMSCDCCAMHHSDCFFIWFQENKACPLCNFPIFDATQDKKMNRRPIYLAGFLALLGGALLLSYFFAPSFL